jgi:hypothetical protein
MADVPTPDRCAVEIESRCFNVCICLSSSLSNRQCDNSIAACEKQCKPTSRFGGDRFVDLETTIRLISALLLAGQPSGVFSATGAGYGS